MLRNKSTKIEAKISSTWIGNLILSSKTVINLASSVSKDFWN